MKHTTTVEIAGRTVELETGRIARQANGAVIVRQGKTVVLVAVTAAREARTDIGFFPLTVEYREQTASVGRIPGGYLKREGRLGDHEVLISRLIDRSIRPLFPKGYRNEVQVVATVLGAEIDAEPGPLALLGAAAALHLSDVPFAGPSGGLTVAHRDGAFQALPTRAERDRADLTMTVSAGPDGLVMVEGFLSIVPEAVVLDALEYAEKEIAPFRAALDAWRAECGREKQPFVAPEVVDAATAGAVRERCAAALGEALLAPLAKGDRKEKLRALREEAVAALATEESGGEAVAAAFENLVGERMREIALADGKRIGGRGPEDIRDISAEVGWLGTNHGSAVFTRGETQALVSCTLGTSEDELREDHLFDDISRRFMLHYNFPPYSVGEARPMRGPGRREIGHGTLARRALEPVLPAGTAFPYTLRLVSNITESNGSSSMASVCGGCLAMMDAGVPLAAPVAGIAMGLIAGADGGAVVLSDILGDEDHLGDMDFKVTGTEAGVTALQMDNKVGGLGRDVLERALEQARRGRLHILERMGTVLAAPRAELPPQAPRVEGLHIRPERIRELIGPRGSMIQGIQETTKTRISVNDTGQVLIYADSGDNAAAARRWVEWVAGDPEVGKLYRGVVVSTPKFGAFIKILNDTEGLCHISEMGEGRVNETTDVVQSGDEVVVRVLGATDQGKLRLSLQAAANCETEPVVTSPE